MSARALICRFAGSVPRIALLRRAFESQVASCQIVDRLLPLSRAIVRFAAFHQLPQSFAAQERVKAQIGDKAMIVSRQFVERIYRAPAARRCRRRGCVRLPEIPFPVAHVHLVLVLRRIYSMQRFISTLCNVLYTFRGESQLSEELNQPIQGNYQCMLIERGVLNWLISVHVCANCAPPGDGRRRSYPPALA